MRALMATSDQDKTAWAQEGVVKEVPHTGQVYRQLNWKKVCGLKP